MEPSTSNNHDDLRRSAAEQAALRRVATLVASGAPAAEVFEALVTEVGLLMPATDAALVRLHGDETVTMIGRWNEFDGYRSIGVKHPFGTGTLARLIWDSKRPSRVTSYSETSGSLADMIRSWGWRSSVGAPVVVNAEVWGLTAVGSTNGEVHPPGTEEQLAAFTELLAIAIANAQSRAELEQLAAEQESHRRASGDRQWDPPGVADPQRVARRGGVASGRPAAAGRDGRRGAPAGRGGRDHRLFCHRRGAHQRRQARQGRPGVGSRRPHRRHPARRGGRRRRGRRPDRVGFGPDGPVRPRRGPRWSAAGSQRTGAGHDDRGDPAGPLTLTFPPVHRRRVSARR
ncbi:GAF domain-containing protein [Actinoplanes sp. LDG1-06]|uniref:GAF domain-containing protein n=1 Tax=Paractinoplanes ovalisporus TaxID=2810368 RepID=A0ABS2AWL8_9ACTN|nr:GAF domain-containing protein [Actinoplanes ovalisporus]